MIRIEEVYNTVLHGICGPMYLEADETGVTAVFLEGVREAPEMRPAPDGSIQKQILEQAVRELSEYFRGERTVFETPLHLEGTEFQKKVWNALRQIPYGETRSYADVAAMIGQPKACRAVGGANNKNPVLLMVPCHRVIGKDGSMVGFAGDVKNKEMLLQMEAGTPVREIVGSRITMKGRMVPEEYPDFDIREYNGEVVPQWIAEALAEYEVRQQGEYTIEDYYALPDDYRCELIDGVFYAMGAPTVSHQIIATEIWKQLEKWIDGKDGKCLPLVSPLDVQLDCDEKTMVQPDVLVVCDLDKVIDRCVYGAPDFVVEIFSPSTERKDSRVKLEKYRAAGVREYWMVDLKRRRVLVENFAESVSTALYRMDQMIPVAIFGGECQVDFSAVYEKVKFLLEKMN